MPYTKRLPHYTSAKELIEYILDEKHFGEKAEVVTSINCNIETVLQEFKDINKKYKVKGNRVAYHLIQSFHPDDKITAEQANEIAKRMCEEIYPDFQCLIVTHIDRAHINNHICINSTNIYGRKLEDRLANEKEGLYGFTEASDRIAAEYGCFIMPKRTFKKYKNKDYYYYQYREQSYRDRIKIDIDEIKIKVNNMDELIDELGILGYEIRRGKHISVKAFDMSKFIRLYTLGDDYSVEELNKFFKEKNIEVVIPDLDVKNVGCNEELINKIKESKIAIEKSQLATKGKVYTQYQQTKYKEIRRFYQLKNQLEYMDSYNIRCFEDLEFEIQNKRNEIKLKNIELKKQKYDIENIMEITNKAQDYIQLKRVYDYAIYYKNQDKDYILPKEAEIFLKLQNELKIESVKEARELISKSRTERIAINQMKKEIVMLQRELNHLDTIKEEQLSKSELYIHNIKFGGNRINYQKSDDKYWYVSLPNTNENIKIEKKQTAFNEKLQIYTLYLVDDMKYSLYDKKGYITRTMTGTELDNYVMDKKKEIEQQYANYRDKQNN